MNFVGERLSETYFMWAEAAAYMQNYVADSLFVLSSSYILLAVHHYLIRDLLIHSRMTRLIQGGYALLCGNGKKKQEFFY